MSDAIYWGDLHNHNNIGYGKGTIERSYEVARGALDVYAFSPHGWWPDPPTNDEFVYNYHMAALDRVRDQFQSVVDKANAEYVPGKFVTFPAYEWHSSAWGDCVLIFPGGNAELRRSRTLEELQEFGREFGAILIPHHVAYRPGWRGTDWSAWAPDVSPVVEVFSEHGNSMEAISPWQMLRHSMGGAIDSQTAIRQIRAGRMMGFVAGTDNHYGHPASAGEGITGIIAPELTRESIFAAIRARHTFATSGDRMQVSIDASGAIMGDSLPIDADRHFDVRVAPLVPLSRVDLLKNGESFRSWAPTVPETTRESGRYAARLQWGWGLLDESALNAWSITVEVARGAIETVYPSFAGGKGSTDLINTWARTGDSTITITSFTSRLNDWPISEVTLIVDGGLDTEIRVQVDATVDGEPGACQLVASLGQLTRDDVTAAVRDRFSAPKVKLCRSYACDTIAFHETIRDEEDGGEASYLLRVEQRNGHVAYASPISYSERA